MCSKVTINITEETLAYITDPAIFHAKKAFTRQLCEVYTQLIEEIQKQAAFQSFPFPTGTDTEVGKISRGENYREQPYLVCDFPRLFQKDNLFAYRIMFWWGHYFIFTFHLAGKSLETYWPAIRVNHSTLQQHNWWVSNGQAEWEHAVDRSYYVPAREISREDLRAESARAGFLKVAHTLPLHQYKQLDEEALHFFNAMLSILQNTE